SRADNRELANSEQREQNKKLRAKKLKSVTDNIELANRN
ncbi:MAG: hypothetical protein PWQ77_1137, partial [Kosmotogales bacterium]|nr:hypothetical protein [Kosmotogales bacterium]